MGPRAAVVLSCRIGAVIDPHNTAYRGSTNGPARRGYNILQNSAAMGPRAAEMLNLNFL
jgi:hypothetical protein